MGTGIQTSLNELCALLLELMGSSLRPEYHEARKVANVQTRRAGIEKAASLINFRAKVSLREGLQELIRWRTSVKLVPVEVEA